MGRIALSHADREAFRRAMRDVATKRFAAHGERGVTMRGLAEDLGVSPMTAYRYFADKDEIFDLVRASALEAFAVSQERAAIEVDPIARLRTLARAYVEHAIAEPDQYRVIFQLEQPAKRSAELAALEKRSWLPMRTAVGDAIDSGSLVGDPDVLAHVCWATVHGLVSLELAGKLGRELATLVTPAIDQLIDAARSTRRRTR